MVMSPLSTFSVFLFVTLQLSKASLAQNSSRTATDRPRFTLSPEVNVGAPVIANVNDPLAINAQSVCPGYAGSNVVYTAYGLTATLTLAGEPCNIYGTDVDVLNLTVEYQSVDRLVVKIIPAFIDHTNASQYLIPDHIVLEPKPDADAEATGATNDLRFVWSNLPTFSFSVYRNSTRDLLFSTEGTKLVFENQFVEFISALPEHYNLYGLGERIRPFRLNDALTTIFAADTAGGIDV